MIAYKAVVFDLDGTLLDTCQDIAVACNRALEQAGFSRRTLEQMVSFVGNGARSLVMRASGCRADDPQLEELLDSYLRFYEQTPCITTKWLPFVKQTFDQLTDIPIALYTNKPRAITLKLLDMLEATHCFKVIVAGGDMPCPKPSPDGLLYIAKTLQIKPCELAMVGDGPQDIESARQAGATSIAISAGYTSAHVLQQLKPDILLPDMQRLVEVLRSGKRDIR